MRVDNKNEFECSGCTTCLNICPVNAITMKANKEGFLYPNVDEKKCINCGLCYKACPFSGKWYENNKNNEPIVYAFKNNDNDTREKSTSGGFFSILAEYVISNKGVVYGASLENLVVKHIRVNNIHDISKLRGSKYVQSELNTIFKQVKKDLDSKKMVLFSGTPCQIAGLKAFLKKSYDNLITVDIVCHGVPSSRVFNDHILMIEKKYNKKVDNYRFRSKVKGWHEHTEAVLFEKENFEVYKDKYIQSFKFLYAEHSIIRKSCTNCKFSNLKRVSDITLGDFWGIEKYYKKFDDNKGISLILINSAKGKETFNNVKAHGTYIESDTSKCLQSNLKKPTRISPNRDAFWKQYNDKGYDYIIKKYSDLNYKVKLMSFAKRIIPEKLKYKIKELLKR